MSEVTQPKRQKECLALPASPGRAGIEVQDP